MSFTTERKMKAAQREIALRKNVYPVRVKAGVMKQSIADEEIAVMQAIYDDYAFVLAVEWSECLSQSSTDASSSPTSGSETTSEPQLPLTSTRSLPPPE